WETDAPLREAMMNIRQATHGAEALQKAKDLDATQANALAKTIRDNIAYMVANCQLPPDADATLHVLIGRLAIAADQLSENEQRVAALTTIHDTLQLYSRYFSHAGWSGPVHEH
ncbi:MAG TPA: DnrO protein, partial [Permianibacter sp.]|nr:DnrO protein [Permianibacter sp.]